MPKPMAKGLMKYGKTNKTKSIKADLEGKADDPGALAAWVRRQSLGQAEFKRHQAKKR